MATRDWRQVLTDAAQAAGATSEAALAVPLLEAAGRGEPADAPAAAAALRALVTAFDHAARSRRADWNAAALTAVRASLRVLPRLIGDLGALDLGALASATAEHLDDLASAAAGPADDGEPTALGLRCPRCGSRRVDEQHTDGTGFGRHVDVLCEACALAASFDAGAPEESTWRD